MGIDRGVKTKRVKGGCTLLSCVYYVTKMNNVRDPQMSNHLHLCVLTLIGFTNHIDDLGGLQGELVSLLGSVLFHALDLRAV